MRGRLDGGGPSGSGFTGRLSSTRCKKKTSTYTVHQVQKIISASDRPFSLEIQP